MSDGTADAAAAAAAAAVPTLTARDLEILVHAFQTPKSGVEFEVCFKASQMFSHLMLSTGGLSTART